MADCSGSTPLKALSQQSSQDRSLQRDRTRGNTQGGPLIFRSNAALRDRGADHSYQSFSSANGSTLSAEVGGPGMGATFALDDPPHAHQSFPNSPHAMQDGSPFLPMNRMQSGEQQAGFRASPAAIGWAADFAAFSQRPGHADSLSGVAQGRPELSYQRPLQMNHPQSSLPFSMPAFGDIQGLKPPAADFDTAMNQWMEGNEAHRNDHQQVDAMLEKLAEELGEDSQREVYETESSAVGASQHDMAEASGVDPAGLASDPVQALSELRLDEEATPEASAGDSRGDQPRSEVSEAARQLLETVKHEESTKWQQSQFLMLMRDFRDGSKDIVDNEIRLHSSSTQNDNEQMPSDGDGQVNHTIRPAAGAR